MKFSRVLTLSIRSFSRSHSNRRDTQHESRRGTGYSITQTVERLPLPQIHVTIRNTNTPMETGVQTSQDSRNSEPNSQGSSSTPVPAKKYVFKTILITDSIIRHINDLGEGDALGNNHILDCISKSDTSGLNHLDLKRKVRGIQPAYIYIHLGVNDMLNGSTVEAALKNLKEFISYRDEYVTHAKIILSLPLPTLKSGHRYEQINLKIIELRNRMKDLVNKDTHKTLDKEQKDGYVELADYLNNASDHPLQLNTDITEAEVKNTIKSLKTRKASSIDMISNEILKSLDTQHQEFLTIFLNVCFEKGVYPWNESGHRYEQINLKIIELRMKDLVNKDTSSSKQPKDRKILMNTNSNLGRDGKLKEELCCRDGIHLTTKV